MRIFKKGTAVKLTAVRRDDWQGAVSSAHQGQASLEKISHAECVTGGDEVNDSGDVMVGQEPGRLNPG